MEKVAVIFPGIGYHADKPLLYYGRKLASELGYRIIEVNYSGFESDIRGDAAKMKKAFEHALNQSREILSKYIFSPGDDILVISKSVGTVVAGARQQDESFSAKNIYFTPVEATFELIGRRSGIVFHGTGDPWVISDIVVNKCAELKLPLYVIEGANHSLEKGELLPDLKNLSDIMLCCRDYLCDRSTDSVV